MTVFLDTSVLVPVFLAEHPHHEASLRLFSRCSPDIAYCAAHSLVETYSTLTRLPRTHRASADEAILFLGDVLERLTPVGLEAREYAVMLREAAVAGVSGGAVYDFLISRCALAARAEILYTWNLRHYIRLGDHAPKIVKAPESLAG